MTTTAPMTTHPGCEHNWANLIKRNQDAYGSAAVEAARLVGEALDKGQSPEDASRAFTEGGLTFFMAAWAARQVARLHPRGFAFGEWFRTEYPDVTMPPPANVASAQG